MSIYKVDFTIKDYSFHISNVNKLTNYVYDGNYLTVSNERYCMVDGIYYSFVEKYYIINIDTFIPDNRYDNLFLQLLKEYLREEKLNELL